MEVKSGLKDSQMSSDVDPPHPYSHAEQQTLITTAYTLHIPECIDDPPHALHLPKPQQPLRINIEGPLLSIQKMFPDLLWQLDLAGPGFPQPGGQRLAKAAHEKIYGREPDVEHPQELVIRDEYLGWITGSRSAANEIDYYGVTFDHLVPDGEDDPEVLQINIIEMEEDGGSYARQWLRFEPDLAEYRGKMILAVPRCCAKRKGTTDRRRVNDGVRDREGLETGR